MRSFVQPVGDGKAFVHFGLTMRLALAYLMIASLMTTSGAIALPAHEDVVVIGRIKNLTYEHIDDANDILGHGWITAEFHVKRVLLGRTVKPKAVLRVRYVAHTYMREDRELRFRLRKDSDGRYVVCTHAPNDGVRCN